MIVVMRRDAKEEDIQHMIKQVESLGLKPTVLRGTERTVIAAIGDERIGASRHASKAAPASTKCFPSSLRTSSPAVETKSEPTVVRAGSLTVGGGHLGVIAGPCSVESEEQIVGTARAVKEAGATALRGGAFKPRTSPYSFQGLKEEGLQAARHGPRRNRPGRRHRSRRHRGRRRSSPNTPTCCRSAPATCRTTACSKPSANRHRAVLLKRGPSATVDELLLAAEYILDAGNQQVMLCERGIRTFEAHTRFTLPLATVPYLHAKTHLPVVVDPSHGTGHTPLVPAMARAAIAAGADGLIVEVHPNPEKAMSDGYQSLTFDQFDETMHGCRRVAEAMEMKVG